MSQHIFNLKRQLDHSDDPKLPRMMMAAQLPLIVDIRSKCPQVFDQGELGSCTANAGVGARMILTGTEVILSRLFQYYQERKIDGTIKEDSGAQMKDICVALQTVGVCPEADWPYDITKFAKAPNLKAIKDAGQFEIKSYATFDGDTQDDIQQIKQYLATVGQPVLIGMDVYESFESAAVASTGKVPMPITATEKLLGGHAVLVVGYDDNKQVLIVRNSWGDNWGDKGYFYMPYAYVEKHIAYDTWTISM